MLIACGAAESESAAYLPVHIGLEPPVSQSGMQPDKPRKKRHPPSLRLIPSKPVPDQYVPTCPPAPTVKVSTESSSSAEDSSDQSDAGHQPGDAAQQTWMPGMPAGSGATPPGDPPQRAPPDRPVQAEGIAAPTADPPLRTASQTPPVEHAMRALPVATVKQYPTLQPNATLPELTYDEMQHRQPLARLSLLGANWGSSRKRVGSWAGHVGLGSHLYFLVESLDHRMREDVLSKGLAWVQQKAGDPAIIYRASTFEIVQQKYHTCGQAPAEPHTV